MIALVVLGHSVQTNVCDFDGNLLTHAIYSFHMAAFMSLSGFLAGGRERTETTKFLRTLGRLLSPFFAWWFIAWLAHPGEPFLASLAGLLRHPDGGLWFLYVLALCHAWAFALSRLPVRKDVALAIGALLPAAVQLLTRWDTYGFHFFAWYFLFFAGGGLVRMHPMPRLSAKRILPVLCLAAWAVMVPAWQRNTPIVLPALGELPGMMSFGYRFAAAALGTAGFWLVFKRKAGDRLPMQAISRLGRMTLGVYAIHGFVLAALKPETAPLPAAAGVAVSFMVALPASALATASLRRIPALGRILTG